MANNRMWLRCKMCYQIDSDAGSDINPYVWLGKTMGGGWYMSDVEITQDQLVLHEHCYDGTFDNNLFELVYETTMTADEWSRAIQKR